MHLQSLERYLYYLCSSWSPSPLGPQTFHCYKHYKPHAHHVLQLLLITSGDLTHPHDYNLVLHSHPPHNYNLNFHCHIFLYICHKNHHSYQTHFQSYQTLCSAITYHNPYIFHEPHRYQTLYHYYKS